MPGQSSKVVPEAAVEPYSPIRLAAAKPQSLWRHVWRRFCRHRLALLGVSVLLVLMLAILLGPLVYDRRINDIDFTVALQGPSLAHPLGTDDLGQDLLARLLYGGRVSMAVGLTAMLIAIVLGVTVGAAAGYCGGWVDNVLMRLTDLFIALPQLPLLLLVVYLFRDLMRRLFNPELGMFLLIVLVIGGLRWMQPARLVRAMFLSLKEKEYVEAAEALGTPPLRLILRHILPNALSPVIVAASLGVASAILAESALSFLGLGFPPDMPTWGRLLFDAKDYLDSAPHWALFPGIMLFLVVLSINYVGDGLRDALDARKVL
jgi:peptide/nickel transport system permease protein